MEEKKKGRWFNGEKCCLKECSIKLNSQKDEVLILATDSDLLRKIEKSKQKEKIKADWKGGNKTCFHSSCFEKIVEESEKRGRGKERMNSEEKKMVAACKETVERFDPENTEKEKIEKAAELIKNSKHLVCFTGAGVSVSAGIATYRGTDGVDTKAELGQAEEEEGEDVQYTKLSPTLAHRALSRLFKAGILKHVITQNVDHLHQRAMPAEAISALHGDVFVEYCGDCGVEYERDYEVDLFSTNCYKESWFVKCSTCGLNHFTGRICDEKECGGKLKGKKSLPIPFLANFTLEKDTIINFGDMLRESVLDKATSESEKCDVILCMGSSLSVSPANKLPLNAQKIIIVNLQKTDLDCQEKSLKINSTCDEFMSSLLRKLAIPLQEEGEKKEKKRKRKEK